MRHPPGAFEFAPVGVCLGPRRAGLVVSPDEHRLVVPCECQLPRRSRLRQRRFDLLMPPAHSPQTQARVRGGHAVILARVRPGAAGWRGRCGAAGGLPDNPWDQVGSEARESVITFFDLPSPPAYTSSLTC